MTRSKRVPRRSPPLQYIGMPGYPSFHNSISRYKLVGEAIATEREWCMTAFHSFDIHHRYCTADHSRWEHPSNSHWTALYILLLVKNTYRIMPIPSPQSPSKLVHSTHNEQPTDYTRGSNSQDQSKAQHKKHSFVSKQKISLEMTLIV